jgi:hypothetical protein
VTSFTPTRGDDRFGAAYEALRGSVLAGASYGGPVGLVLLLREGLAAWMSSGAVGAAPVAPERRVAAPIMAGESDAAVVRVLATMALGASRRCVDECC